MFKTIVKNAFKMPDLRKKMLFVLMILLVLFRLGAVIPVPFVNADTLAQSGFN